MLLTSIHREGMALMLLEEELLAIEKNFWTGGPEVYRHHVDKKCLIAFIKMAGVMSYGDTEKSAEKGRWRDVCLKAQGLLNLSDTATLITYECSAMRKDGTPHHALASSGYVKRSDSWKLAFHQQTPLQ